MSKSESYLDWELAFRNNNSSDTKEELETDLVNSIGIPKSKYEKFLKEWRKKNLN
jgi:hypothetical protein